MLEHIHPIRSLGLQQVQDDRGVHKETEAEHLVRHLPPSDGLYEHEGVPDDLPGDGDHGWDALGVLEDVDEENSGVQYFLGLSVFSE